MHTIFSIWHSILAIDFGYQLHNNQFNSRFVRDIGEEMFALFEKLDAVGVATLSLQ